MAKVLPTAKFGKARQKILAGIAGKMSAKRKRNPCAEEPIAADFNNVKTIYEKSEEQAEAELLDLLSPMHLNLLIARQLQRIVSDGGKAGSDAARMLRDMQRELCPNSRKATVVSFQPIAREENA